MDLGVEVEMNDENLAAEETKNVDGAYHLEFLEASPTNTAIVSRPKKTFLQSLAVFTGIYWTENPIKLVLGPFVALLSGGAFYAIIMSAIINSFYVGVAILQAGVFSGPPLNLTPSGIGFLSVGPCIGALIGTIFFATTSDWAVEYFNKTQQRYL
jgi:hypothetical protein